MLGYYYYRLSQEYHMYRRAKKNQSRPDSAMLDTAVQAVGQFMIILSVQKLPQICTASA